MTFFLHLPMDDNPLGYTKLAKKKYWWVPGFFCFFSICNHHNWQESIQRKSQIWLQG
jgi:hypothetical protein